MIFRILCKSGNTYFYDNLTSEIFDSNNILITFNKTKQYSDIPWLQFDKNNPIIGKSDSPSLVKIQLGLSCNMGCTYCSQRFVPGGDYANVKRVELFLNSLDNNLSAYSPNQFAFWGGEPFVYWKMLKPLAEGIRRRYPVAKFNTTTNGTLLTKDIIDWIYSIGMHITLSHDGPSQHYRGYDILNTSEHREIIKYLFKKLAPEKRVSVYSVLHSQNYDIGRLQDWFQKECGDVFGDNFELNSTYLRVYSDESESLSHMTPEKHKEARTTTFNQIISGEVERYKNKHSLISEWLETFHNQRPAEILGQACSVDKREVLIVDLFGNVITCQNVTIDAFSGNGESHKIGHISKLNQVKLNTSTHWSAREECYKCPVLQTCRGSCMYLQDNYFKATCNLAYTQHIPYMAAAFLKATGDTITYIEAIDGSTPADRKELWNNDLREDIR